MLKGQLITKQVLFGMVILACITAIAMYSVNNVSYATPAGNKVVRIAAGGANITAPWTVFLPQLVTINVGDSIEWYNPTIGAG